ncbi:MAG: carbamate kinase, partial [Propionivibrio sp.]
MTQNDGIPRRLIVAVGGNALQAAGTEGTASEQTAVADETAHALLPLLQLDNELVFTHGNGPAVGKLLMRNAFARDRVAPMSLDILVADTQGATGYILTQAFENALREIGNSRHVVGLVSQVEVDTSDPGFQNPTKPIGHFFSEDDAKALMAECGWKMKEDAGRGWRVVVASPEPKHIC